MGLGGVLDDREAVPGRNRADRRHVRGHPWACTGMTARVRCVIRASRARGSRLCVTGSMSQKTGTAPWWRTAMAVATKLNAGTITSSPGCTPAATTAQ